MEAVKVRVQTRPGFARGLNDGLPKFVMAEGTLGLFKGLVPLWGRQIPFLFTSVVLLGLGMVSLYLEAVKKLGLLGLFTRGLPLRIAMIGTLTGAQWLIYDSFKCLLACK
ncbi:hypothetical protein HPP92_005603 [Vanilla planifolia]|nr:hypothetical protein HPP92_005603 [Vanilla planifolia]